MAKIIAKRPILLANHIYQPGDLLPAWDAALVAAWLEAGSAVLVEDDTANIKKYDAAALEENSQAGDVPTVQNSDTEPSDNANAYKHPAATPSGIKGKSNKGKSKK